MRRSTPESERRGKLEERLVEALVNANQHCHCLAGDNDLLGAYHDCDLQRTTSQRMPIPSFPPELERELFETTAYRYPNEIPTLLRVAHRVLIW